MKYQYFQHLILLLASYLFHSGHAACFDNAGTTFFDQDTWMYCQEISEKLFMYYSPMIDDGNVMVGLYAPQHTDGWSALAVAGNGGMKGASQMVVRRQDDDMTMWMVEDRHSDDYTAPTLDDSQDLRLLFAEQSEETGTVWGILMKLNSCDEFDYAIGNYSRWMHWALGSTHEFGYHGTARGQFHANLLAAPAEPAPTDDLEPVDMVMPNVPVVLGEGGQDPSNPYVCTFFNMAEILPTQLLDDEKVHAVRMSPLLDEASSPYVHHMLLYQCEVFGDDDDESEVPFEHLGVVPECESMPRGCYAVKFAWAVGGQDIVLPDNVGVPFPPNAWVALQMHYYNPNLDPNITDSSGLRAFLAPAVREIDAGFLEINGGTSPEDRAPLAPGRKELAVNPLIIPSECTTAWSEPLNILGVIHHMHLVGSQMRINVERDGQFLGTLRTEHRYDFNHQSFEASAVATLEPGDRFSMQCVYDTSSRTEETIFGDLSQQEMCYGLVLYYPHQPAWETFGYFDVPEEQVQACTTAGTGNFTDVSLCTQVYVTNLPLFFGFYEDGAPYGALDYCNAQAGSEEYLRYAEFICPECYAGKNCTEEDIFGFGLGVCQFRCADLGVSLYPDTTNVVSTFSNGIWCGEDENDIDGYVEPMEFAPEPMCEATGDLSKADAFGATDPDGGDTSGTYYSDCYYFSLATLLLTGTVWNVI